MYQFILHEQFKLLCPHQSLLLSYFLMFAYLLIIKWLLIMISLVSPILLRRLSFSKFIEDLCCLSEIYLFRSLSLFSVKFFVFFYCSFKELYIFWILIMCWLYVLQMYTPNLQLVFSFSLWYFWIKKSLIRCTQVYFVSWNVHLHHVLD